MTIERLRPSILRVTLHTYEWASLVAAAQWALERGNGDLPPEAQDQIEQVLASYDAERTRIEAAD